MRPGITLSRRLRAAAVSRGLVPSESGATGTVHLLRGWVAEHEDHCGAQWTSSSLPDEPPLTPPRTVSGQAESAIFEAALASYQTLSVMRAETADVAVLPGGRVVSEEGFVITHDGLLAVESGWDDEKIETSGVLARQRLPRATEVPGVHASLISQWCTVYYHWITDVLPRIGILERTGCSHVPLIVPQILSAWQQRSLELLGIGKERLTPYDGSHIRADKLIWPRPAATTGHTPRWACDWLRERFVRDAQSQQRRLYLTRRREQQRRVVNEDAVWALLSARGFEMVDPGTLTLDEQIKLFTDAAIILSPHGGALTNIVFSRNATIIELFEPSYVNPCYYALAERSGHGYWYVMGETRNGRDMAIDPTLLDATLTGAGAS